MSRYGLIQTALPWEFQAIAGVLQRDSKGRELAGEASGILAGQACRVIQTGMGQRAASRKLTRWLRENSIPSWIASIGLAGGLNPRFRVGDCLVAGSVVCATSGVELFSLEAGQRGSESHGWVADRGRIVTVSRPALDDEGKVRLFEEFGAAACDMETFAVARVAEEWKIPWIAVRVISDAAGEHVPRWMVTLGRLMNARRRMSAIRLAAAHPRHWLRLALLAMRMRYLRTMLADKAAGAMELVKECVGRSA